MPQAVCVCGSAAAGGQGGCSAQNVCTEQPCAELAWLMPPRLRPHSPLPPAQQLGWTRGPAPQQARVLPRCWRSWPWVLPSPPVGPALVLRRKWLCSARAPTLQARPGGGACGRGHSCEIGNGAVRAHTGEAPCAHVARVWLRSGDGCAGQLSTSESNPVHPHHMHAQPTCHAEGLLCRCLRARRGRCRSHSCHGRGLCLGSLTCRCRCWCCSLCNSCRGGCLGCTDGTLLCCQLLCCRLCRCRLLSPSSCSARCGSHGRCRLGRRLSLGVGERRRRRCSDLPCSRTRGGRCSCHNLCSRHSLVGGSSRLLRQHRGCAEFKLEQQGRPQLE